MNSVIDADAAKLAGLLTDQLQKIRQGSITLNHLEWFNNLSKAERNWVMAIKKHIPAKRSFAELSLDEIFNLESLYSANIGGPSSASSSAKFVVCKDLGEIIVPDSYDHTNRLAEFIRRNRNKFQGFDDSSIIDANFSNPSRVLKPGDRLIVRVFSQTVSTLTTTDERLAFLATQNAVHVGMQGLSLVFEQKRSQLPKGRWYVSLDEKKHLWRSPACSYMVPIIEAHSNGAFCFTLVPFEYNSYETTDFLCFTDIE